MSHMNFSTMAFFTNFVLLKLTCLVTLFGHKLKVFKNSQKPKIDHFWHFWWTFVHSKCKLSSLRSKDCKMRFLVYFKPFKAKYGLMKCSRLVCMFRATSPKQGWKFLLVRLFDLGTISLKPFLDLCVALIWIILVTWVVAPHALNLTFVTHVTPHSLHSLQSLK